MIILFLFYHITVKPSLYKNTADAIYVCGEFNSRTGKETDSFGSY